MNIPEPKVELHEGREIRQVPIYPELLPFLEKALLNTTTIGALPC